MVKNWFILLLSSFLIFSVSGCAPNHNDDGAQGMENQGNQEPLYREQNNDTRFGTVQNDMINGDEAARGGGQNEIGYFKYIPENYTNKNGANPGNNVFIDRSLLARQIAQMVTVLPNVKDGTALVTDDHVFIGITTKNGKIDRKTAREAKRTAESLTPRYFKVYVTSDKKLNDEIKSVGMRMTTNKDIEGVRGDLEDLLRKMGDDTPPDVNGQIEPNTRREINPQEK
ncbi:YhcN/YlaJ family sporulation lipoprotein [Thermoactinomyces mirandus]|uniref:YhcN/YlaJ family sporulation lipoprotein n=1 Tax=Thermoactinomyces mirandus TaxID=2756294 RepID=A0A7W1XTB2_9BACL|nr:YhcN/YlaJ family sporulation lipoprotein [Thermoactinomyces mirandus]MBA4602771.1 YhcN/YlaJ family sporulation lipoprotein [Thermoactinomyces mirandus]